MGLGVKLIPWLWTSVTKEVFRKITTTIGKKEHEMKTEKSIKTSELIIEGNIMRWEGTMVQLSNISCISIQPLQLLGFPKYSLILLIIGVCLLKYYVLLGILLMVGGGAWLYAWNEMNVKRKSDTILTLNLNSGENLRFIFYKKDFLEDVLTVLEYIIINGGVGEKNISIDISGCNISGNASILNDIKLS